MEKTNRCYNSIELVHKR